MAYRGLAILAVFWAGLGFCGEGLWYFEQDFVKFGKKEAYEKYKKEMLMGTSKGFTVYAAQQVDASEYIYLVPVDTFCAMGDLENNRAGIRSDLKLPYASTLNFTVKSLNQYLPDCSFVPKERNSMMAFPAVHYYVFTLMPGSEGDFEVRLKKIAGQTGICFRSWKVIFGANVPKYVVAVFGDSEKGAKSAGEGLELITVSMKNVVITEQQGSAVFRKDLSVMK